MSALAGVSVLSSSTTWDANHYPAVSCTDRIYSGEEKNPAFCANHLPDSPAAIPVLSCRALHGLSSPQWVLLLSPDIRITLLLCSRPCGSEGTTAAGRVQDEGETTDLYNLHYFLLALFRYYFRVLKDAFLYLFTRI